MKLLTTKPLKIALSLLIAAALGFLYGSWSSPDQPKQAYDLASETSHETTVNDWAKLPCPSELEFQSLAAKVKLEIPEGAPVDLVCDNGHRAKLAKVLFLMTRLRMALPSSWPEQLREDLAHPFDYLASHSIELKLNLDQVTSVAYYHRIQRAIFLGGSFFSKASPLVAIGTLVHEARHSVQTEPGHTLCEAGDTPRNDGGCDQEFSMDPERAGAYSYEALFYLALGLYSETLSPGDREDQIARALYLIGARINVLPSTLARRVDLLAWLGTDHKVRLLHPFGGFSVEIPLNFPLPDEFPVRIELSSLENELLLFTNKDRLWVWNRRKGLKRRFEKMLTDEWKVADFAPFIVPFSRATMAIRTTDDRLYYARYSPEKAEFALFDYPLNLGQRPSSLPMVRRMFLALADESAFLSKDGELFFAPHFANEDAFRKLKAVQSPDGWIAGTGGALYDSLFLIDTAGRLHSVDVTFSEEIQEEDTNRLHTVRPVAFAANHALKKFTQGLKIKAGLTMNGDMVVWSRGDTPLETVFAAEDSVKVEDLALMQEVQAFAPVGRLDSHDRARLLRFAKACGIDANKMLADPWLGRGLGLNSRDELIAAGKIDGSCVNLGPRPLEERQPYQPPK